MVHGSQNITLDVTNVARYHIAMMRSFRGKAAEQVLGLMDELEEQDDVQRVHANFDIPDSVIEAIAA